MNIKQLMLLLRLYRYLDARDVDKQWTDRQAHNDVLFFMTVHLFILVGTVVSH